MSSLRPALPWFALSLLAACSSQGPTLACGPGTVQQGDICVASAFCDPGAHLEGALCVADLLDAGPPVACGQGTVLQGTICVPANGDGGVPSTWGPSVRVAPPGVMHSESPRLAVNSVGDIFVAGLEGTAYSYGDLQYAVLWVSRDRGQTFSILQVQLVSGAGTAVQSSSVAIDASDRIAWSWSTQLSSSGTVSGTVFVSFSNDGATFSSPTRVSVPDTADPDCRDGWLSIDRSGTFYLSWVYGS